MQAVTTPAADAAMVLPRTANAPRLKANIAATIVVAPNVCCWRTSRSRNTLETLANTRNAKPRATSPLPPCPRTIAPQTPPSRLAKACVLSPSDRSPSATSLCCQPRSIPMMSPIASAMANRWSRSISGALCRAIPNSMTPRPRGALFRPPMRDPARTLSLEHCHATGIRHAKLRLPSLQRGPGAQSASIPQEPD